ncbi:MAG: hypothetical protein ABI947_12810 [Chloroflexota bacterium]
MSYATSRIIHGQRDFNRRPSLFNVALGGKFLANDKNGFSDIQANEIAEVVTALKSQH